MDRGEETEFRIKRLPSFELKEPRLRMQAMESRVLCPGSVTNINKAAAMPKNLGRGKEGKDYKGVTPLKKPAFKPPWSTTSKMMSH